MKARYEAGVLPSFVENDAAAQQKDASPVGYPQRRSIVPDADRAH
jgi:hypothetical protein